MKEEAKEKEQAIYKIEKVKLKSDQLTVDYIESYPEANYRNNVTKASQQFVHPDLKYALSLLKAHVAAICEMPEAKNVNVSEPSDDDLNERLKSYIVTGYSKGGSDESAGVSISAQKLLKSGQVLNLSVPFTKYEDESGEGYSYGQELLELITRCDYEVDAYLFDDKWGVKQESFDFDAPEEADITGGEGISEQPKKRGRKKKAELEAVAEEAKVFDEFA